MIKTYVEFTFQLSNGSTKKIIINDVKEDITENQLIALSDLIIEKGSHYKGILFTEVKKCSKFNLNEEEII